MVKYEDSGRALTETATNRCRFGFLSVPVPFSTSSSSLSQEEKEIKNKLSTDSPCIWATQCWVIERNHSRTCEDCPYFIFIFIYILKGWSDSSV